MYRTIASLSLLLCSTVTLLAQAEDESPYSSSTVDTPSGDFFATNGVVIVCALIFFGLMIFLLLRGRKRA